MDITASQSSFNFMKPFKILISIFFIACAISTIHTITLSIKKVSLNGENSTGEAGKVYYAHKFQEGEDFLQSGKTPPYYPAVHGLLLHASVGFIGRVLSLDIEDLYYIGRSITVFATLVSLLMIYLICKKLLVDFKWSLFAIVLFLAPFRFHTHMSSYRPEYWILCLSLLSCFICINRPKSTNFILILVLPILSYLIKAPGIIIAGCIFFSFIIEKRYKVALLYAVLFPVILGITIIYLYWITDGVFGLAFQGGMKVGFSIHNIFFIFKTWGKAYEIWYPIIITPFIFAYLKRDNEGDKEKVLIVSIFWLIETLVAIIISTRFGSNSYYFLMSYTYSTIIVTYWIQDVCNKLINKKYRPRLFLVSLFVFLIAGSGFTLYSLTKKVPIQYIDGAIGNTLRFGNERSQLANWINKKNVKCYSDDGGLNVLLKKPMVIYPYVQNLLFITGYLDKQSFFDQIRRQKIDLIILTTSRPWIWQGINQFPKEFFPLVKKFYKPAKFKYSKLNLYSKYLIFIPKLK